MTVATTVFKKLDGIRNQYCSITTKLVYCSALYCQVMLYLPFTL